MFGSLGWQELLLILLIVLIIFGAGKLPEIGSALGRSIREFRRATHEEELASQQQDAAQKDVS
jgi:sec-independent protein translocase protein TatA